MEYIECATHEKMSICAADYVVRTGREKPDFIYSGPSGDTATLMHRIVERRFKARAFSSDQIRVVQLDEWYGLGPKNVHSCQYYTRLHITGPLQISQERFLPFNGDAPDPYAECRRVEQRLKEWGGVIDLMVLGLGLNGHVALNEPTTAKVRRGVHVTTLSDMTRSHPMLGAAKVEQGMTLGIADILKARKVLLLVSGTKKRTQLHEFRFGDKTPMFPASLLRDHPNLTIICDRSAADYHPAV